MAQVIFNTETDVSCSFTLLHAAPTVSQEIFPYI